MEHSQRGPAERIARFTAGRSYEDYWVVEMLRSAVERQFEIVGEAFAGLRRVEPGLAADIPDLPRIVAFRNVLIHGAAKEAGRWPPIRRYAVALRNRNMQATYARSVNSNKLTSTGSQTLI